MKIYLLPGLGYDCRIFENLSFKNYEVEYINWIDPLPGEDLNQYVGRMCDSIINDEDEVVLIGHSLGGIVAQELSTMRKVERIILISSIRSRKELPFYLKIVGPFRLQYLFTKEMCIKTIKYWGKPHGFDNSELQEFFKSMVGQQSNKYLQWALKSLSVWIPPKVPRETSVFRIHGTNDKTLPYKLISEPDVTVKKGSHILVYKRYGEVNDLIMRELDGSTG